MDRRGFLKAGGAAAAGAAGAGMAQPALGDEASSAPSHADRNPARGAVFLSMAVPWGADLPGFAPERLARRIAAVSDGRFRVETRTDAAAGSDADLAFGSVHALTRHHPAFAFFAGLPGRHSLDAWRLPAWLAIGGGQMLWDELAAGAGIKPLVAGHSGPGAGLWTNARLETAADLAGIKFVADGSSAELLRGFGGEAVLVAPGELEAALADGRADVAEWPGPLAAAAAGLQPLAQRTYEPGLAPAGTAFALTVRGDLWQGLSAADQAIFEACAAAEYQTALAEAHAHAAIARRSMAPVARLAFTAELENALDRAASDAIERVAGTDPAARRIADSYRAFRDLLAAEPVATS